MKLESLRAMAAMVGLDFAKLEEDYTAVLLAGDAVAVAFVDGKPELRVIDCKTFYGRSFDQIIFDDIEPVRIQAEPLSDQRSVAKRTQGAKKPLPYYLGSKRRF